MYSGWLLKIGDYVLPKKFIKAESYKPYVNMQDVEPWTDANGYLHRTAVELKVAKIEWETRNGLTNTTLTELLQNIQRNYIIPKERRIMFTAYIPEYDDYVTQIGYLSDFQPNIFFADENRIQYDSIRLSIIGGVYDG